MLHLLLLFLPFWPFLSRLLLVTWLLDVFSLEGSCPGPWTVFPLPIRSGRPHGLRQFNTMRC